MSGRRGSIIYWHATVNMTTTTTKAALPPPCEKKTHAAPGFGGTGAFSPFSRPSFFLPRDDSSYDARARARHKRTPDAAVHIVIIV